MTQRRRQLGFTLIELLVIMAIVSILAAIALSALGRLFSAGATATGQNVVDAQLRVARSLAIRDRLYTGVRFQADADPLRPDVHWAVVVQEALPDPNDYFQLPLDANDEPRYGRPSLWTSDPNDGRADPNEALRLVCAGTESAFRLFVRVPEIPPARLPNSVAVGRGEGFNDCMNWVARPGLPGRDPLRTFRTFTVVFAPDGHLVTTPGEVNPRYIRWQGVPNEYRADAMFCHWQVDPNITMQPKWKICDPRGGLDEMTADPNLPLSSIIHTRAVRVVDLKAFMTIDDAVKDQYLNEYACPLPIAPYVGGLLRAE